MNPAKALVRQALTGLVHRVRAWQGPDEALLYAAHDRRTCVERRFINVGAGSFSHPYWTNVDYQTDWYAGVQTPGFVSYDLTAMQPLPFADASIEICYTSHTIEHVSDLAVENLLRECHRVLRPGGGLRVTCPDAALMYQTILDGNLGYWVWRRPWFAGPNSSAKSPDEVTVHDYFVSEIATRRCRLYRRCVDAPSLEELRKLIATHDYHSALSALTGGLDFDPTAPGEHINFWDEDKLMTALRVAGFGPVYRSRRGQSRFAPMTAARHFDTTMPMGSLYVEGIKGA